MTPEARAAGQYGSAGLAAGGTHDVANGDKPVHEIIIMNDGGTITELEDEDGPCIARYAGLLQAGTWAANVPITCEDGKPFTKIVSGSAIAALYTVRTR